MKYVLLITTFFLTACGLNPSDDWSDLNEMSHFSRDFNSGDGL